MATVANPILPAIIDPISPPLEKICFALPLLRSCLSFMEDATYMGKGEGEGEGERVNGRERRGRGGYNMRDSSRSGVIHPRSTARGDHVGEHK
jgi:hypothetical protein